MEPYLDNNAIFDLKVYADKRDLRITKLCAGKNVEGYGHYAFESFEQQWVREMIDREFNKFPIRAENNLLLLPVRYQCTTTILSAQDKEELRKSFIRFMLAS